MCQECYTEHCDPVTIETFKVSKLDIPAKNVLIMKRVIKE